MDSINGTAKELEDYVKVKEIVEFEEKEEEKQVRNKFIVYFISNDDFILIFLTRFMSKYSTITNGNRKKNFSLECPLFIVKILL